MSKCWNQVVEGATDERSIIKLLGFDVLSKICNTVYSSPTLWKQKQLNVIFRRKCVLKCIKNRLVLGVIMSNCQKQETPQRQSPSTEVRFLSLFFVRPWLVLLSRTKTEASVTIPPQTHSIQTIPYSHTPN